MVVGFLVCVSIGYFIQPTMSRAWRSWCQFLGESIRRDERIDGLVKRSIEREIDLVKRSIEREIDRINRLS